jgi:CelD/BcsL family acetyltransferase involved in cellulose biosynthesis
VEEVDSLRALLKLEKPWRALQEAAGCLPFTSWEWNITWWRELSRHSVAASDRLFLRAIRSLDGELVGIAPLMLREYPARGLRFRSLRFFGADPNITELRGPLCRPEHEGIVYDALLDHLLTRADDWTCLILDGIREKSTLDMLSRLYGKLLWSEEVPSYQLTLPKSWEEFRATRSRNIKESLRKCHNSLKRAGLVPVHRVASKGVELELALSHFFDLHGARARLKDTTPHKNVFDDAQSRRFLRALVATTSAVDGVRIFTMDLGDRTVAARIGFCVGRSLYLYYSGYDPAYRQYSVMTTVVAQAIQYAIEHGFETVNLSTGNDFSKTRWSPSETIFRQAIVPSPASYAELATMTYLSLRWRWLSYKALTPLKGKS